MSDNNDFLRTTSDNSFRLRADVLALMLKGAGYAAVFVLVIWAVMAAIYGAGKLLPEESRDTPDPTPFSYNLTVQMDDQA